MMGQFIGVIDIGTTKVVCGIAACGPEGFETIGVGVVSHSGVKQGVVTHIGSTVTAIRKARKEAESMAGTSIHSVWLSIGGTGISYVESSGMVAICGGEVSQEDVDRVLDVAQAIEIPSDRRTLQVLPTSYTIDGQGGLSDPVGLSGFRLETKVQIVTGPRLTSQNTIRCIQDAGLKIAGLASQSIASSLSVLNEDEKSMGVTVVDIGGGTCDFLSYHQGALVHMGVLSFGGQNFTNDVAVGLRTTMVRGEELKKEWGVAFSGVMDKEDVFCREGDFGFDEGHQDKNQEDSSLEAPRGHEPSLSVSEGGDLQESGDSPQKNHVHSTNEDSSEDLLTKTLNEGEVGFHSTPVHEFNLGGTSDEKASGENEREVEDAHHLSTQKEEKSNQRETSDSRGELININKRKLCTILEARSEELLSLLMESLENAKLVDKMGAGIVLTGGGSHLKGLVEMGNFLFEIPVKQGLPLMDVDMTGTLKGGEFSTVLGLLSYAYQEERKRLARRRGGHRLFEKCRETSLLFKNYVRELF